MTEVRMKESLAGGNSLVRAEHQHFLKEREIVGVLGKYFR